jgi:GntR family transcriptional repressor for pyruvate dehydrogenase complex
VSAQAEIGRVEIASPATHETVAEAIRRWIALGTLAPGDRLPTERELADRLGVGRMTLRQAVRRLGEEGLVRTVRGRAGGTFVLDDVDRGGAGVEITEELLRDVHDNFEFRLGVEPVAARLAAERAESIERWAIRGLAEGVPTSIRVFRTLDSRFHLAIADAGRNRLVAEAIRRSRAEFFRWADAAWERVNWQTMTDEEREFGARHRPIAEAIQAGDSRAAEARMAAHLVEGRRQFLEIIDRTEARR